MTDSVNCVAFLDPVNLLIRQSYSPQRTRRTQRYTKKNDLCALCVDRFWQYQAPFLERREAGFFFFASALAVGFFAARVALAFFGGTGVASRASAGVTSLLSSALAGSDP